MLVALTLYLVLQAGAPLPWVVVHRGPTTSLSSPRFPQIVVMPSGAYVAAFTSIEHYAPSTGSKVLSSVDRGMTWTSGESLASMQDGSLIARGDRLWMVGVEDVRDGYGNVVARSSTDLGRTWAGAGTESQGLLQAHTRLLPSAGLAVVQGDRVWRAIIDWGLDSDDHTRRYSARVVSASLDSDWARVGNWWFNETIPLASDARDAEVCMLQLAGTAAGELTLFQGRQGQSREFARARVDRAVLEWHESDVDRGLPANALSRRIARDDKNNRFLALVGVPTGDPKGLYSERDCHVLSLWTSTDLVTWETSGLLLRDASRDHFTIRAADWAVEGDDLLVLANVRSLTAEEHATPEQIVFLRVPNFRERSAWSPPLWGTPLSK
jgi:hypothetical protein